MEDVKQVIIVCSDVKMGKGKAVAQGAHAAVRAYDLALKKYPEIVRLWRESGEKKIVVKATLKELLSIYKNAKDQVSCALISDAGLTQLEPGTITALALGPARSSILDTYTAHLKLL
ncbi:MAG: peptidyl-tRNA hydrolase Pth2 [Candidatus Micrarchaeia archaeon]